MIALCLCACDSAEKKKPAKETPIEQTTAKEETKEVPKNNDKYVYIDAVRTLHIDKRCVEYLPRMYDRISSEATIYLHGIRYILKNYLVSGHFSDYCSQCTEVEDYEEIEDIVRVNENRRKAYDLLDRHFNMPPYDEFYTMLDGEEKRKKAYNSLIENGHKELGKNYEEFLNNICLQNQLCN